jgi:hypothetical protein
MKWRTETQGERLRYALGEKSVFIMPLLALLAIAILIVALGTSHAREKSLPPVAEIAEVIRFGAWQGRPETICWSWSG